MRNTISKFPIVQYNADADDIAIGISTVAEDFQLRLKPRMARQLYLALLLVIMQSFKMRTQVPRVTYVLCLFLPSYEHAV